MKSYKNLEELNKEWKMFGYYLTEKGEIIGTHQNKKYKVGEWKPVGKEGKYFNVSALFYHEKDIQPIR